MGLIRALFDGDELARAMGWIGPVMGLASVCGPVLGGVLTHAASWRAAFLVNVPLGVGVLLATGLLKEDRSRRRPRLDLLGTALVTAAVGLVTYPPIQGAELPRYTLTWAAGLALAALFALHQRRRDRLGRSPLVEPGLFTDRGLPAALLTFVLFFAVVTGLTLVVVVQLQLGPRTSTLTAGLTLLPWSAAMAVSSWTARARLVPRYGVRVLHVGLGVLMTGVLGAVAVHALAPAGRYPWPLLPALAVCGLGQGLFAVPFFTTALHRVRPHETGSAAGLLDAVQQLGSTLGVALLGSVFFARGAGAAFGTAAGLLLLTGVTAGLMTPRPRTARSRASGRAGSGSPSRAG